MIQPSPSTNGYAPAPPQPGGAVRASAPARFPDDLPAHSGAALLYAIGRGEVAGVTLLRWIVAGLFVLAFLLWLFAGSWLGWLSLTLCGIAVAAFLAHRLLRARDFVTFTPAADATPVRAPQPLSPSDKVPVYVTGALSVNQRVVRFTCLPAFYRTFATRERVLIGARLPRPILRIASWPERNTGLWYAFVRPGTIASIRTGTLHFGGHSLNAVEIVYDSEWKTERGSRRSTERLLIGTSLQADIARLCSDLAADHASLFQASSQRKGS
jgi:hypothetical protein